MPIHRRTIGQIVAVLFAVTAYWPAHAQPDSVADATPEVIDEGKAGDPLGRETPRGSFDGFITAAEAFEWETAANYLDLRNLPQQVRGLEPGLLAEQLHFILQRRVPGIDGSLLSNRAEGQAFDSLPEYRDELTRIDTMEGEITLLMQRVPGPDDDMIWKISNVTVAAVPGLHDEFSYPHWVEAVRGRVPPDKSFVGVELFKWVILLGFAIILIPIGWLIAVLITRLLCKKDSDLYDPVRHILAGPVLALVVVFFLGHLLRELGVGARANHIMQAKTLVTLFSVWLIWAGIDLWRARRRSAYERQGRTDSAVLGRPLANAVKLLSVLIGVLFWLANAGVDITALLAGLGVGGVALALALQKPIEDLFGALSIYSQQPLATGDLCKYQDQVGLVEEVGLRSTRFRTLSNTVVHVPNSQLAYGVIENITSRKKIMYHPDVPLRYDTSREQLEQILTTTRTMLTEMPDIENETIRVHVAGFTEHAITMRVRVFATTTNFDEYVQAVEQVNLALITIVEEAGAHFAAGARTVFLEQGQQ